MATNENKDLVYPKVAPQTISAFSPATSTPLKGPKVASLVSAINAKTQTQHSPLQTKQNFVEETRKALDYFPSGTRSSSYDSLVIQPQTLNNMLEREISDGSSSEVGEDKVEQVPALSVAMTRSLGRNEFLRLKPGLHRDFRLSGEIVSTKSSSHTMKPVSSSLKVIPKGKVESNPFFQLDRQRSNLKQASSPMCKNQQNFDTSSIKKRDHLSDSISIKMRIKLWSEMEMEAKQQQVPIERRKSAHLPIRHSEAGCDSRNMVSTDQIRQRSTSMSSLHIDATKEVDELVVTNTKAFSDTAEIETQSSASPLSSENVPSSSGSVDKDGAISVEINGDATPPGKQIESLKSSASGISKGLSKLSTKLLSPRFHRKKLESEHQGYKEPANGIGGRSSKKRKAFKSKVVTTTNSSSGASDELVLELGSDGNIHTKPGIVDDDDEVFAFEELNQRANSVSEKSRKDLTITKERAESQPIDPQQLNLTTGTQAGMESSVLDGTSLNLCEDKLKGVAVYPQFLRSKPSHRRPEMKDRTDTHEVVDSLGNASFSEIRMSGSGESSSDGEPCATTTKSGSACSSLGKEMVLTRSTLKRRASENVKSSMCTSPEKVTRIGSISPYQDSADALIATPLMYADAVWDRDAQDSDEISFEVDDVIEILDMTDDVWWQGSVHGTVGWFPASFVRLRIGQESDDDDEVTCEANEPAKKCTPGPSTMQDTLQLHDQEMPSDNSTESLPMPVPAMRQGNSVRRRMTIRRKDSAPNLPRKLTPTEVRAKVVEEILSTERDYVRNLEDIVEGFLNRCRDYSTLFDSEKVETIFSNVEEIYRFQRDFLRELESKVDRNQMECSEIGGVFVINKHEFAVYSQYCNNHPHAVNEMNILQQNEQYTLFFESCRLLRNLQDISLEGFLLTPVQKICKYPLQLSELLKYTDKAHPDHGQVVAAQQAMKEVAMQINEQKRRMENVGRIGVWQLSIDNWKGPDILEKSTELIHSGELHKISKGHSQERHFFLFDQQLIYCKKEIGGKLSYKGRLNMEECQVADVPDGTALHGNSPIKNAWRMKNKSKDKWYIIYAKTLDIKSEWMDAFRRERKRVLEDHQKGFHISMKMKRAAVSLVESSTEHIKRRKSFSRKHILFTESVDSGVRQRIDSSSSGKKLAVSGYLPAPQPNKKLKSNKKKL